LPATTGTLTEPGLIIYRFAVGLFFANAAGFAAQVRSLVDGASGLRWFALLADGMDDVDFTGGRTVAEVATEIQERGVTFVIVHLAEPVRQEFDRYGVTELIGPAHYYDTLDEVRAAFHDA
jgi:MFS superfamily sulfate permease-like transporter